MLNSHRRHSVLIVDDEKTLRTALRELLRTRGYEVFEAANADTARDFLATHLPDAVLLDIVMPGTDGFTFLQELRAAERTRFLPVLLVSSLRRREEFTRAITLGANDFIPKPVESRVLEAKLEAHLRYRDALVRLERHSELLGRAGAFDPLTQLFNQRWLLEILSLETERSALRNQPLALAMIEADVILMEREGHDSASHDEVLQVIARRLEGTLREADALARYAQDGFCAVLPGVDFREAATVAERMRHSVESRSLPLSGGGARLVATIGVAWIAGGVKGTPRRLVDGARLALDEARHVGSRRIALRNLGTVSGSDEAPEDLSRTQPIE